MDSGDRLPDAAEPTSGLEPDAVRVLHVDDEPGFAAVVERLLEDESEAITVVTETDPADALERVRSDERIDCVVSDYDMAGIDGLELLRAVRERRPGLPFVLFTGTGSEEIASEAISAGVTDYLQKGSGDQYAVLANRVLNAVAQHRATRGLRTRIGQQEVIAELGRSALDTRPGELSTLFEEATTGVTRALDAEAACVLEHRRGRDDLRVRAGRDCPVEEEPVPTDEDTLAGYTLDVEGPVVVSDDATEDRFTARRDLDTGAFESGVGVPIGDADPWGVLVVYDRSERAFAADDVTFVQSVANLLATAVDRVDRERRLSTLISNLPGIVYRCENAPEWPMEFVGGQAEALTGYTADEIENDEVLWGEEVIVPEDREWLWETVQESLAEREPFEVTYRIETKDGERRWMWEQGRGIYTVDDDLEALEGFITDITERKENERRLQRERDRLDEFASIVSHDLRNPIEVAIAELEMARRADDPGGHLDGIETALGRMTDIIDDVLTLARQEPDISVEAVPIADVAADAWETAGSDGSQFVVEGQPGTVTADRGQLQQLLENLFANAVEHGSTNPPSNAREDAVEHGSRNPPPNAPEDAVEHGSTGSRPEIDNADGVTVTLGPIEEAGDLAGFYVADDGAGVAVDDTDRLFDPGYSEDEAGIGLGLAIVERIADAHGWTVSVEESSDGGARFEMRDVERG